MPPKVAKRKDGEMADGEDPLILLSNYQKYTKLIGIPVHHSVVKSLTNEEIYPIDQVIVDEEGGPIGPGGTRALMTAVMGSGPGMKGGPYKLLKYLRFWRSNIEDEGVNSVCEVLRLGGGDVKLAYLEFLDCHLTSRSGHALGSALSYSNNVSLLTLKLDFNLNFGSQGLQQLCVGLRTNRSLRQLHLQFCSIDSDGGEYLADVLSNSSSRLEVLNVAGNRLRGTGLLALCKGLMVNSKLTFLSLADNMIEQTNEDIEGLTAFRDCLLSPTVNLSTVDLMFNRIGTNGAQVLVPALTPENKKIKEFLIDVSVPLPLFDQIFRRASGGKKGKKGSKKGGKKK